jgi:Coenzyme PQQ synthesis protein D (PqqD)
MQQPLIPLKGVKRPWTPGCLANISHRLSPQARSTWQINSYIPIERTHAVYAVSSGVRTTRNEDGGIVLDIDHGQVFRLNPVGSLILESLGKGWSEIEIAKEISRRYSISEETAVADVGEFLESLEEHDLIHEEDEVT